MEENHPLDIRSELFYIELSIISFRNYFKLVEENLQTHRTSSLKKYHEITRKLQDENYKGADLEHLYSSISSSLSEIEIAFIQRYRFSVIIQLYSFLESELRNYCELHFLANSKEFNVKDLRGENDLDKIKKYLTKSANNNVSENKLWPFVNNLRKLRNCIVHSDGLIEENNTDFKSLKTFSKNNFVLFGHQSPYIIRINETEFIELCFKNVEEFLVSVIV